MRKLFVCIALGLTTLTGNAASPLWMRDVQISPDGTEIAFCYKGDIYKVSAGGGTAIQLTTQPSYECTPIWSPDSKQIAFASDRNGNFDIFVMPAAVNVHKPPLCQAHHIFLIHSNGGVTRSRYICLRKTTTESSPAHLVYPNIPFELFPFLLPLVQSYILYIILSLPLHPVSSLVPVLSEATVPPVST